METLIKKDLDKILELHKKWLKSEDGGQRADLRGVNLREADLRGVNLRVADLFGANLRGADLREADLRGADLRGVDLRGADLRGADLRGGDLRGADLYWADLRGVNLLEVNLRGADLRGVNLRVAKNFKEYLLSILPDNGEFLFWKKVVHIESKKDRILLLKCLASSQRLNAYSSRKIRVEKAIPVEVYDLDKNKIDEDGFLSKTHGTKIKYNLGKKIEIDDFCQNKTNECAPGIHGFITFEEARDW